MFKPVYIVFKHQGQFFKWRLRLAHIDSPEMKSKDPNEKKAALESKKYLESLILNKTCVLECHGIEKFYRLLGVLKIGISGKEGLHSVNQMMLDSKHAYRYEGGTKLKKKIL